MEAEEEDGQAEKNKGGCGQAFMGRLAGSAQCVNPMGHQSNLWARSALDAWPDRIWSKIAIQRTNFQLQKPLLLWDMRENSYPGPNFRIRFAGTSAAACK